MRLSNDFETPLGYCEHSISNKMMMVAELFESDVLSEDEALKACKVIIGQHAKVRDEAITTAKLADRGTTTDRISSGMIQK